MSDVKLKATIEGDSKPLQNALNQAGKTAESTAKDVSASSAQVGKAGQASAVKIGDAIKHPIQTIRTLTAEAKNAALALLGMGKAGQQAGQESKEAGKALGSMIGVGSKMAIIAKGFQSLKSIVSEFAAKIRDAYKDMMRLATMRFNANAEIYGKQIDKWRDAKKELADYYNLWKKANSEGATAVDKENEINARRSLEHKGIDIDPNAIAPMEKQIRQGIDTAQAQYIKALEAKEREAIRMITKAERAFKRVTDPKYRLLYGSTANYEAAVEKAEADAEKYKGEAQALREQIVEAKKHQTPGADFSAMAAAEAKDRLAAEIEKETKAREEASKREREAFDRMVKAEDARAKIEEQLEKEGRLEAMQHTREVINHKLGRFGFQLNDYDDENMAESTKDRIQRRRNIKLDARIGRKLERQRAGKAVHFTSKEQARIDEQNALRQQGKDLTAEEKAMRAAEKEEAAAERLKEAADAINKAAEEMKTAKGEKENAQDRAETLQGLSEKIDQTKDFYSITSTTGSISDTTPDYGGILSDIRDYLKNDDNVYVVK